MTPLDYFTKFIEYTSNGKGEITGYRDTRTGETFQHRREINEHCQRQAENFESKVE